MMNGYIVDLILCGIVYLFLVYFMVTMMRKKNKGYDGDDDDEGGLPVTSPPEIDLPPGVCLPDGSPRLRITEDVHDEVLV